MAIFVLALLVNVNLRVEFFISRFGMNAVARQVIQTHQALSDRPIGVFDAEAISPCGPDMLFRIKNTYGVTMYYSVGGRPPADWEKVRLDGHWHFCVPLPIRVHDDYNHFGF